MTNPFGIGVESSTDQKSIQSLFYFMREFKLYPFDREYIVRDKEGKVKFKITKKGIPLPLYTVLLNELNEHYKKEAAEMKRAKRK